MHAAARDAAAATALFGGHERLRVERARPARPGPALRARRRGAAGGALQPRRREQRRRVVRRSARDVGLERARRRRTCSTRCATDSPGTRFYQASSGEMFGSVPGASVVHDEASALNPQSPYAAAKAAAHLLCRSYRESYDLRIACGILFNHESHRRGGAVPDAQGRRPPRTRCGPAATRAPLALGQPEGAARLGLRARLRRRDGRDPAPGRRSAACPTRRASTATTCSAPGGCTTCGSSSTAPSRSPASSSLAARGRRSARVGRDVRGLGRAGGRRRPRVHPPVRPAGDRRRPDAASPRTWAGSRARASTPSSRTCSPPARRSAR